MIYCQTINKESIAVHPLDDTNKVQFVELIKYGKVPMFAVYMDYDESEWFWEFKLLNPSDYERVKINIFDAILECDTMPELAETLDTVFEDSFEDILITEDDDYDEDDDFNMYEC